jgi:hypothetical protein
MIGCGVAWPEGAIVRGRDHGQGEGFDRFPGEQKRVKSAIVVPATRCGSACRGLVMGTWLALPLGWGRV